MNQRKPSKPSIFLTNRHIQRFALLLFCTLFPLSLVSIYQLAFASVSQTVHEDTISHPGDLDPSFNQVGYVITVTNDNTLSGRSVAIQSDGKILVCGPNWATGTNDFSVTRFHPNGELDTSFNGTGIASVPIGSDLGFGCDIALQSDDKIIVAGTDSHDSPHRMAAVRFDQNGLLDPTFADDGVFITSLGESSFVGKAVTVTPDDRILIVGRNAVVQLTPSGSFDSSFDNDGVVKPNLGFSFWGQDIAFRNDKVAVAGGAWSDTNNESNYLVMRYNSDGSLDTTFNQSGYVTTSLGLGEYDTG